MQLAMTQELTQAIALLQYNSQELYEFIQNKAIENPLIEIETGHSPATNHYKNHTNNSSNGDKQEWLEQIAKKESSLAEHLFSQISLYSYESKLKNTLTFLINSLDENGYLRISVDEVSSLLRVSCKEVEEALHFIQGLEPVGVGARNLQECLLLQLNREEGKDELAIKILSQYFIEFADKKWKPIAKELGIELKDIQEVFDYVQTLNPRPASDFSSTQSPYITPDVMIKWDGCDFVVSTFGEALPSIKFNQNYYQYFNSVTDKKVNEFLQDKKHDYQWIMKSIQQRKETILRVSLLFHPWTWSFKTDDNEGNF